MFVRVSFWDLFSLFFLHDLKNTNLAPPFDAERPKLALQISQVGPKAPKKYRTSPLLGVPGTNNLPESIPIELLMICCSLMIDSGHYFANWLESCMEFMLFWVPLLKTKWQ